MDPIATSLAPMPVIDIRTLILVSVLAGSVFALSMAALKRIGTDHACTRKWALGANITALGCLLVALRGQLPDMVSILLANFLIVWGLTHVYLGSREFLNQPPLKHLDLALGLIVLAGFIPFTYWTPDLAARIIIVSAVLASLFLHHGWLYLTQAPKQPGMAAFPARVTGIILLLGATSMLVRTILTPSSALSADFMTANQWLQPAAFITLIVVFMTLNVAFPILIMSRMQHALEVARARYAHLSATDPLTGIANRRRFDEFFAAEWSRHQRTRQPLAVMMLDIDFFKQYNDRYGHPAGDTVLRRIAAHLAGVTRRPGDLVARYGGEEFVIIAADTPLRGALQLAQQIRESIEALAIPHTDMPAGCVTVSLGVAVMDSLPLSQEILLAQADHALYQAKARGRNQVASAAENRSE